MGVLIIMLGLVVFKHSSVQCLLVWVGWELDRGLRGGGDWEYKLVDC